VRKLVGANEKRRGIISPMGKAASVIGGGDAVIM